MSQLTDRLRGNYEIGENAEFGHRSFADFIPPISIEAADRIETLEAILSEASAYLNTNKLTSIGAGSILHRKFAEASGVNLDV